MLLFFTKDSSLPAEGAKRLAHTASLRFQAFPAICYDSCMRKAAVFIIAFALYGMCLAAASPAQTGTGTLEFMARITPTAARPEPVRQFTFYILTKSYTEIVKEEEEKEAIPTREEIISGAIIHP